MTAEKVLHSRSSTLHNRKSDGALAKRERPNWSSLCDDYYTLPQCIVSLYSVLAVLVTQDALYVPVELGAPFAGQEVVISELLLAL